MNTIFLHVSLSSPVEAHRRFGGTLRLHLQSRTAHQTRSRLFHDHEDRSNTFLRNVGLLPNQTALLPSRRCENLKSSLMISIQIVINQFLLMIPNHKASQGYIFTQQDIKRVSIAVIFQIFIREYLGSNYGRDTGYSEDLRGFIQSFHSYARIRRRSLTWKSFQVISHRIIQTFQVFKASLYRPRKQNKRLDTPQDNSLKMPRIGIHSLNHQIVRLRFSGKRRHIMWRIYTVT